MALSMFIGCPFILVVGALLSSKICRYVPIIFCPERKRNSSLRFTKGKSPRVSNECYSVIDLSTEALVAFHCRIKAGS